MNCKALCHKLSINLAHSIICNTVSVPLFLMKRLASSTYRRLANEYKIKLIEVEWQETIFFTYKKQIRKIDRINQATDIVLLPCIPP